ncbi:MAG: methyltransferase domain-containing protein [Erysipelotrichaceae bacterium]|nr:methyltransferase domain-containing protein [Erysipelotrichaceae bacterium]MDP3304650.1 methyltransferase domain-containing protein [Erysipelotrichaceae bacterium]
MSSQEYFNSIAMQWNQMRQTYFQQDVRPWIFQRFDPSHKVIADIGSGTGFLALSMAKKAKFVFAIDQSIQMLHLLQKKMADEQIGNVMAIHHDMKQSFLLDKTLQAITMNMSLHHIPHPDEFILQLYRLLDDGGELVISDVMEHCGEWARAEMHDEWLGFHPDVLRKWLLDAGFEQIEIFDTKIKAVAYSSVNERVDPNIFIAIARKGVSGEV